MIRFCALSNLAVLFGAAPYQITYHRACNVLLVVDPLRDYFLQVCGSTPLATKSNVYTMPLEICQFVGGGPLAGLSLACLRNHTPGY